MSRKRSGYGFKDDYKNTKLQCVTSSNHYIAGGSGGKSNGIDTKTALKMMRDLFPVEKFENRIPPIILQHQLYDVVSNRTAVDLGVERMRSSGEIRCFKIGNKDEVCIVFSEDYIEHVEKTIEGNPNDRIVKKFLKDVFPSCIEVEVSIDKKTLMDKFRFEDKDITSLVNASVLTFRDIGSWWLAIPGAGLYVRSLTEGRSTLMAVIRRTKFKEILLSELERKSVAQNTRLGVIYLTHDIIGGDLVSTSSTSSGRLLRLHDSKQAK